MDKILYKYRGIQNFRFFVDILMRNRLFAATYKEMNDPMEGQYYYNKGQLNRTVLRKIASDKENLRICSLSRLKNNELLWSHYAEGHHGVVVGVGINESKYDVRPIQYTGIAYLDDGRVEVDTPREILSHKLNVWSYEEEERVFVLDKLYVDVKIKQVITGRAMSNQDFGFVRDLLERVNPSIELIKASTFM